MSEWAHVGDHVITKTSVDESDKFEITCNGTSIGTLILTPSMKGRDFDYDLDVWKKHTMLRHELDEAKAEITRHHKDFEAIREIVHPALDGAWEPPRMLNALKQIRAIVG